MDEKAADRKLKVEDSDPIKLDAFNTFDDVKAKLDAISEAVWAQDLHELRELAISPGGLLTDELRRKAWPLLLGTPSSSESDDAESWRSLLVHKDEGQVGLDVNRSFVYYPENQSDAQAAKNKAQLSDLITAVLRQNPYLHYFQGYHDICQVLLLVLSPPSNTLILSVARLSALRIRDFMLPTLQPALSQLRLIPPIIEAISPKLASHLHGTQPFFALSGTLTMYAHDIASYSSITRLFDVLLSQPPIFSIYMFAQIVLDRAVELLDIPEDEPEMLHSVLSKLPKGLDLDRLIHNTKALKDTFPPETLRGWGAISPNSVLKTARYTGQLEDQEMEDGEKYFFKQVAELKREEQKKRVMKVMWENRRPAAALGVALLVVLLSYQMRKSPSVLGVMQTLWSRGVSGFIR